MNAWIELRRRVETWLGLAAVAAASVAAGAGLADESSMFALVLVVLVAVVGLGAVAVRTDQVLLLLVATAPIGLEQLTNNQRSLLPDLGGWAFSSLRLAVLVVAGIGILALRGLPRRLNLQELAYAALVVYLTVSLAVSPDVFDGVRFIAKIAVIGLAWLAFPWVIRQWGEPFVWKLLLWTLAFVIAGDLVMAGLGRGYNLGSDNAERFGGITGAPAAGALVVGVLALAALYLWLRSRHRVALVLYLLAWIPVFLSLTRIAVAAFLAASVLLAILMRHARQAVVIILVLGFATYSYAPLRERTAWGDSAQSWDSIVQSLESTGTANLNTGGRENLWRPLWREWKKNPVFGEGAGASTTVLARSTHDTITQAHSDYLALLVNGGAFGLGLWLFALLGLAVRFARKRGRASVAAAGILLYLIAAITDNSIEMYAAVGVPLALLIALALEPERPEA